MERIIIDTDPGVDDAQAILIAAAHPGWKIEALTTVAGNVGLEHTLRNALTLTEIIGQGIPVYKGCDRPLIAFQEDAAFVHGSDGLGDCGYTPKHRKAEEEHAVLALLRLINAEPGALTLAAIGPLTNVAMALRLDPQLPTKVKRFIVMGGAVTAHGNTMSIPAEFNIYYDPEAAHIVFEAWAEAGEMIELVDLEVTRRHSVNTDVLDQLLAIETERGEFLRKITVNSIARAIERVGKRQLFAPDAVALAAALEPDIVTKTEEHYVAVELTGQHTRGQTVVDWNDRLGKKANAKIILEIDNERYMELYVQAIR